MEYHFNYRKYKEAKACKGCKKNVPVNSDGWCLVCYMTTIDGLKMDKKATRNDVNSVAHMLIELIIGRTSN